MPEDTVCSSTSESFRARISPYLYSLVLHLYWWKGVATFPWGARDMPTVVIALWLLT